MAIQGNLLVAPAQQYSETIGQGLNNIAKMYLAGMENRRRQEQMELERQQNAIANRRAEERLLMEYQRLGFARQTALRAEQDAALEERHRQQASEMAPGLAGASGTDLQTMYAQAVASGNDDLAQRIDTVIDNRRQNEAQKRLQTESDWRRGKPEPLTMMSPDLRQKVDIDINSAEGRAEYNRLRNMNWTSTDQQVTTTPGDALQADAARDKAMSAMYAAEALVERARKVQELPARVLGASGMMTASISKLAGGPLDIARELLGKHPEDFARDLRTEVLDKERGIADAGLASTIVASLNDPDLSVSKLLSLEVGLGLARMMQPEGRLLKDVTEGWMDYANTLQWTTTENIRNNYAAIEDSFRRARDLEARKLGLGGQASTQQQGAGDPERFGTQPYTAPDGSKWTYIQGRNPNTPEAWAPFNPGGR